MKRAQLIAEAVAVLCPACGEPQPNRDGSEMWTLEDFRTRALAPGAKSVVTCVACDVRFLFSSDTKVMFR